MEIYKDKRARDGVGGVIDSGVADEIVDDLDDMLCGTGVNLSVNNDFALVSLSLEDESGNEYAVGVDENHIYLRKNQYVHVDYFETFFSKLIEMEGAI